MERIKIFTHTGWNSDLEDALNKKLDDWFETQEETIFIKSTKISTTVDMCILVVTYKCE